MLKIILPILCVIFAVFLIRLLLRRAYIYVYTSNYKRPVPIAYLKSDGTIVDVALPTGRRRVGQVYLKDGKGIVRIYHPDKGPDKFEEVGYVDQEGKIYTSNGNQVSCISPNGERHWYELFLRRHAEIPADAPSPYGKCIETGLSRSKGYDAVTLLARAGAAFILYCRQKEGADEIPNPVPHSIFDTALLASFIFFIIFIIPGVTLFFDHHYTVFPFIGKTVSYIVSLLCLYFVIWMLLHLIKLAWLSKSDNANTYITMTNRQTGIKAFGSAGIILSIIGLCWCALAMNYIYVPLFLALLIGFLASRLTAVSDGWDVEPRYYEDGDGEDDDGEETKGDIERDYEWKLDSPLRDLSFFAKAYFKNGEIEQTRQQNPFYQNNAEARKNEHTVVRELILNGEQAHQVQHIVKYIKNSAIKNKLTKIEVIQSALDFSQEDNIIYAYDKDCEEINNSDDYLRLPAETMFDKRGDCDCKAVLAAALIRELGFPVLYLLSFKAEHAAIAAGGASELDDIPGLIFVNFNGQRYYFCETTCDGWQIGEDPGSARKMMNDPNSIIDLS